jgi:peptidoglycan/LPS O-acetylase OafA/YrhL
MENKTETINAIPSSSGSVISSVLAKKEKLSAEGLSQQNFRIYGLDIMRAAAILFVMFAHGNHVYENKTLIEVADWFLLDGVTIFFALSGFLIGGILIKRIEKKDYSFKSLFSFWVQRWLRTLPAYFLILTLLLVLSSATGNPILMQSKKFFFFLQNFYSKPSSFFESSWSLSVEEWFYFITPILIFIWAGVFKVSNKKAILITAAAIILFSVGVRTYRYNTASFSSYYEWDFVLRRQVIARLDSLMFGVIGAYTAFYHADFWKGNKLLLLGIGAGLIVFDRLYAIFVSDHDFYGCVFSFIVSTTGALFFLPYLSELRSGRGPVFKIITHISLISYSIYLINSSLIQNWLIEYTPYFGLKGTSYTVLKYIYLWGFTFLFATLLYKYFEKPIMNFRYKLKKHTG